MLQEILLSLAGGPSPLQSVSANQADGTRDETRNTLHSFLSPAEQALLRTLAQDLGQKNKDIRTIATAISASHPSTVCRAVSSAVISTHLANFQRKILKVEKDVLKEDSSIVGAYNIVPLSAIVGAFDGWGRKLDWLWNLLQFTKMPKDTHNARLEHPIKQPCTAADVIQRLREANRTGYPDIEAMSQDLVKVAETAWLRQVSAWVLYGRHSVNANTDFFVSRQEAGSPSSVHVYDIKYSLVPSFVTKATAQSILFIGNSLNHIRERQSTFTSSSPRGLSSELTLLPNHLSHLSSLEYPINSSRFSAAIGAIRSSLSQNALQKLLPISKVLEVLHILKDFFLLARGEFAVAMINAAEDRLSLRIKTQGSNKNVDNDLASMIIKEGEVAAVLNRTWTTLTSLQSVNDENVDEGVEQARELLSLSIKSLEPSDERPREPNVWPPAASFADLLLPASTTLSLDLPSPLDLFLTPPDLDDYSQIHAYLLGIRRAHLRLTGLFSLSGLRREHPPSRGRGAVDAASRQRAKINQRGKNMRPVWASINSAVFFLAEIGEYFQGEVVQSSWSTFLSWLAPNLQHGPRTSGLNLASSVGPVGSRPSSWRSGPDPTANSPHDPGTLTQAHKRYLECLKTELLLDDPSFTVPLRRLMTSIDHLVALIQRLSALQKSSIVDADDGLESLGRPYAAEEQTVVEDLKTSRLKVTSGMQGLIEALRAIDEARTSERRYKVPIGTSDQDTFVPWAGAGVDHLLLKFDYGNADTLAFT